MDIWKMLAKSPLGNQALCFYSKVGGMEVQETHLYGTSERQNVQDWEGPFRCRASYLLVDTAHKQGNKLARQSREC